MLFDVIYCYCCCSCCLTCCFLFTINDCGEWWCIFQWPPWRWDGLCYLYVGLFQTCSKCVHHHETLFLLKLCCGVIIHLRILGSHAIVAKGFVSLWQHHGDCSPAFESHWRRRRWLSYPRWIQGYFGWVGPTANHASDPEPRPFFHEFQHPRRFLQQGKKNTCFVHWILVVCWVYRWVLLVGGNTWSPAYDFADQSPWADLGELDSNLLQDFEWRGCSWGDCAQWHACFVHCWECRWRILWEDGWDRQGVPHHICESRKPAGSHVSEWQKGCGERHLSTRINSSRWTTRIKMQGHETTCNTQCQSQTTSWTVMICLCQIWSGHMCQSLFNSAIYKTESPICILLIQ